jgi:hypothetical protein
VFEIKTVQTKVIFGSRSYFDIIVINCHYVDHIKGGVESKSLWDVSGGNHERD